MLQRLPVGPTPGTLPASLPQNYDSIMPEAAVEFNTQ